MLATKEQEYEALNKIKEIIAGLGESSYIGTALEGCLEIAEDNIKDDAAYSMKSRYERAEDNVKYYAGLAEKFSEELEAAKKEIETLSKKLEYEQEWRDYESKNNVKQSDYDNLVKQSDTHYLTDEGAKDLLYRWYGFAKEKVVIHKSVPTYQINRHHQLRQTGTVDRRPAYNATDWNYIRFDCGAASYELYNDNLQLFMR